MSPQLLKVAERARREPEARFHSLAHLIDVVALCRSYDRLRSSAAVGVDGVDKASYGRTLEANLKDLHQRLRERRYRHQPIRRVNIPKPDGRTRPLGVSALEDKIVQGAIREVLEAIYEQSFFDSMDHPMLMEILRQRVPDGSMLRLVGKCLKAGVLDGADLSTPEEGTPQGSILSPLLANIYLHHVLDTWFVGEVAPRMRGRAHLIRYADDFVICFDRKDDAERVLAVLGKRMEKYGLKLHPEKTRLVRMERPNRHQPSGKGPGTFDLLGFTAYWRRSVRGHWYLAFKTAGKRLRKAMSAITEYCRRQRHAPVREQHRGLQRRLTGWFRYFGVNGNNRSLDKLRRHTERAWHKWLNRRSQRNRLNWTRYGDMLTAYPLPQVRVYTQIWGAVS